MAQLALWSAVLGEQFGAILTGVRASWQPAINTSGSDWRGWAAAEADIEGPVEILRWIAQRSCYIFFFFFFFFFFHDAAVRGRSRRGQPVGERPGQIGGPRPGLYASGGHRAARTRDGEEVELLERARTLRAAIKEEPGQAPKRADAAPEEQPSRTVTDEVRQAFLAAPRAPRPVPSCWGGCGPVFRQRSRTAAAEPTSPENVKARTPAGVIEVGPAGASAAEVEGAEQRLLARFPPSRRKLWLSVAGAGVLVIIALVDLVTGPTALVVLALIGAVICGIVALVAVRDERRKRQALATDQAETRTRLAEAAQRAKDLEGGRCRHCRRGPASGRGPSGPARRRTRVASLAQAGFSGSLAR